MCGRFSLVAETEDFAESLPDLEVEFNPGPRYNIAPTQPVATVLNDGRRAVVGLRWGLIPSWSRDPTIGARLINARAETIHEKPSFKTSFKRKRCLVLADGFFEWQNVPGSKVKIPHYIRLRTGRPFAFAGLWDTWTDPEANSVRTCTIITTAPNEVVARIHDRMPVILPPSRYEEWLATEERDADGLRSCLVPYPPGEMDAYPVSTRVNKPANDDEECVRPIDRE